MNTVESRREAAPARPSSREIRWLRERGRVGKRALGIAILVPLVSACLTVTQAYWLATILHRAIVDHVEMATQMPALAGLAGLVAARAALAWIGEWAGIRAAEDVKQAIRRDLFANLMRRGPDWMRQRASGELASQILDQVEALDGYFARFVPAMIAAAVVPIAFAIGLMPVDLVVGIVLLVTAPLIPVFMALAGWGAEAASRQHLTALARLSGMFADRIRGLVVLKLFGRAEDEIVRVRAASDEFASRTLAVLRIAFLSSAVLEFFAALGVAGVALYVGLTYLDMLNLRGSELGLQAGLFCLLMAPEVYMPLRTLAAHYHDRANAKAAVASIEAAFGSLPEVAPATEVKGAPWPGEGGAVAVRARDLTVDTPERDTILADTSLDIAAGESVALLGPSGIGKSTLIEVLARLRGHQGSVEIGGVTLEALDEVAFRRHVAVLGQRPRLFHGTIESNIRLGRPGATDVEVRLAATRACVLDFAERLPDGLATPIGERGRGLSGGEAQRVALARIFLRDPALVLLDEPTAHLDTETEARVMDEILAFAAGRTLLIATHSMAVAERMDAICEIDDRKRIVRRAPAADRAAPAIQLDGVA
ncbi:thiol reductant ABC exporter subunit CydD [Kaistia sp. 32K]|uniref:thiol reductant ABC exporter subunit CydD n=1 Tax=Kaistia sp. 32K TaxID=2795690 RepID=UPI00191541A0|nr:thiol reductant ABC exporter subunit CydD [Kaistia sp. 32K]